LISSREYQKSGIDLVDKKKSLKLPQWLYSSSKKTADVQGTRWRKCRAIFGTEVLNFVRSSAAAGSKIPNLAATPSYNGNHSLICIRQPRNVNQSVLNLVSSIY